MKQGIKIQQRLGGLGLSIGGHRSLTILIVSLILFVAVSVYFVNAVVLTEGTDEAYRAQAQSDAELVKFNTALLKQAQDFSANTNNTSLPAGRVNPFGS